MIGHVDLRVHNPGRPWRVRFEAVIGIVQQPATDRSREVLARVAGHDPDARVRDKGAWALRVHTGERWTYGRKGV